VGYTEADREVALAALAEFVDGPGWARIADEAEAEFWDELDPEQTAVAENEVVALMSEARVLARENKAGCVLALDEIQKVPAWSETVKRLWDEDTAARRGLKVIILGSAPLLLQRGLTVSLAGRFEVLHVPHWTFSEMRTAFGFALEQYLYFGGYPGAAP
jgi:predicted AAA+ superfamily ATPase